MARRRIVRDTLVFSSEGAGRQSTLDMLLDLIDWVPVEHQLRDICCAAKGEPAWPPLTLFKAMLIAVWHDLSDVRLAEALDDRTSFRRFCGFSVRELTPGRTAFVRLRAQLVARGPDQALFAVVTSQLRAKAITVKTGTLVDATVTASPSHADPEAGWAGHQRRKAIHSFKAHVGAGADTALVEALCVTPGNVHDGRAGGGALPEAPGEIYADSACRGPIPGTAVAPRGGSPRIVPTGAWGRPVDDMLRKLRRRHYDIQRVRCRIEKMFGTWKRSYGLRRMLWRGLAKATLRVHLTAIAHNLRRSLTLLSNPAA